MDYKKTNKDYMELKEFETSKDFRGYKPTQRTPGEVVCIGAVIQTPVPQIYDWIGNLSNSGIFDMKDIKYSTYKELQKHYGGVKKVPGVDLLTYQEMTDAVDYVFKTAELKDAGHKAFNKGFNQILTRELIFTIPFEESKKQQLEMEIV